MKIKLIIFLLLLLPLQLGGWLLYPSFFPNEEELQRRKMELAKQELGIVDQEFKFYKIEHLIFLHNHKTKGDVKRSKIGIIAGDRRIQKGKTGGNVLKAYFESLYADPHPTTLIRLALWNLIDAEKFHRRSHLVKGPIQNRQKGRLKQATLQLKVAQEFAKRIDQPLPPVLIDDIQKRTRCMQDYLDKIEKKQYNFKLNCSEGYKSILKYKPF